MVTTTDISYLMPMVQMDTQLTTVTTERDLLMLSKRLMLGKRLVPITVLRQLPCFCIILNVLNIHTSIISYPGCLDTAPMNFVPDLYMDTHMLMVLMEVSEDKFNGTQLVSKKQNNQNQ